MFVTPAFAQSAGSPGMGDFMGMILPLVMIMAVFWCCSSSATAQDEEHQDGHQFRAVTVNHCGLLAVCKVVDDTTACRGR